jgi:hypothetical protein
MTALSKLRALLAAATPWPWEATDAAAGTGTCAWGIDAAEETVVMHDFISEHDARLIVALRNAAPELVEMWEAAKLAEKHLVLSIHEIACKPEDEHDVDCPIAAEDAAVCALRAALRRLEEKVGTGR